MLFEELREQHQKITYDSFHYEVLGDLLKVQYKFILDPFIEFKPCLEIKLPSKEIGNIDLLVFSLGLVELISYWKAACPKIIEINAGKITEEQSKFWKDLLIHGLGEFFYRNRIDLSLEDLVKINSNGKTLRATKNKELTDNLILVGGGKDSVVTMELVNQLDEKNQTLLLNPSTAALKTSEDAGFHSPIIVKRTIDRKLIELNRRGYLNGHTPFSAYLAFLGTLVAELYGYKNIIASNEASASEGNTTQNGISINHQYSKSFRFEKLFRTYAKDSLTTDTEYFSFLRPLHESQICKLFARFEKHFMHFRSCNIGQRENRWCCDCPKCAFVFLMLYPELPQEKLIEIFGENLFEKQGLLKTYKELLGIEKIKPFECVGTLTECQQSFEKSLKKYKNQNNSLSKLLKSLSTKIPSTQGDNSLDQSWNEDHFLPEESEKLLKKSYFGFLENENLVNG